MENNFEEKLKGLRKIRPNDDYSRRSRLLLLNSPRKTVQIDTAVPVFFSFKTAAAVICVLVFGVVATGYFIQQQNKNSLVVQANEINASIQVKLSEIKYLIDNPSGVGQENIQNIIILLNETEEALKTVQDSLSQDDLETALKEIKSVQEIFNELESAIKNTSPHN